MQIFLMIDRCVWDIKTFFFNSHLSMRNLKRFKKSNEEYHFILLTDHIDVTSSVQKNKE